MKQWIEFDIHKKEQEGLLYENGVGKKIVGHSKLKVMNIFWGQGECKWPSLITEYYLYSKVIINTSEATHTCMWL